MQCHGVNNAQAIKVELCHDFLTVQVGAVTYRLTGQSDDHYGVSTYVDNLTTYHGCASGIFTAGFFISDLQRLISADELVAGLMPSQGSETCLVVEYMFSLETAFGDSLNIGDNLRT